MLTLSVSQLNRYVKSVLEEDSKLSDIYIKAEISNFKNHFSSGHLYFNLKDEKASVRAVMFAGAAKFLKFLPEEGMAVLVKATVSLYETDGSFQIYVSDMQPFGVGAVETGIRQLTEKLEKKGYFEITRKKKIPKYPKTIGVVTSKTGAAIEDMKKVLSHRYPVAKMKFCPAIVQGEFAADSLIKGIKTLDNHCDVIVIGRGGGSKEDLWAFNNEKLADCIYYTETPVVSAVGHESDTTICDMVADLRAATPSMAIELITPSKEELEEQLALINNRIRAMSKNFIENNYRRVEIINKMALIKDPLVFIDKKEKQLDFIHKTMYNLKTQYFEAQQRKLSQKAEILSVLSPFAVLGRGYAAVFKADKSIKSVTELGQKDKVTIKLQDGLADATITNLTLKGLKNEENPII